MILNMILKYFISKHMGSIPRKYVADEQERMWLTKLTMKATITKPVQQALEGLGIKLIEIKKETE